MSYLYRTGNSRNNIAFTNTANSSTKYLRRTGTGRTNITWTTIPTGSTYNILQRNGTGRNNIAWGNLYIPIPGVALSTKSPGDIVKIKENGTFVDFLVLIHNYPASGRTLLIRDSLPLSSQMMFGTSADYENSNVDNYCENTYYNTIDTNVRNKITSVNVKLGRWPYGLYKTISRKVFVLSVSELGWNEEYYLDGTPIPYISGEYDYRMITKYDNGDRGSHWLRSQRYNNMTTYAIYYSAKADITSVVPTTTDDNTQHPILHNKIGVCPAFTLPSSISVNTSNQIIG